MYSGLNNRMILTDSQKVLFAHIHFIYQRCGMSTAGVLFVIFTVVNLSMWEDLYGSTRIHFIKKATSQIYERLISRGTIYIVRFQILSIIHKGSIFLVRPLKKWQHHLYYNVSHSYSINIKQEEKTVKNIYIFLFSTPIPYVSCQD